MNVVFVAPYLGAHMVHCLDILTQMNVRVGVISHQASDAFPPALKKRLDGHFRIDNSMDAAQLALAVRAFKAQWGSVDRLIGYLEQLQIPLADARDSEDIPGMRGEVARNFRNKNRMKEVLRRAGVPVARQKLVKSPTDALAFVEEVGFPVVIKPVDGMGSKATARANDHDELYQILNQMMPRPDAPVQCEEFVTGEEHTCETAFIDGKPVWRTSTYYLPGPLKVLENPWMQYCVLLPKETQPHLERFAPINTAALQALGMQTGLSHMEWFLRADGTPVVNEVGARPPGVNIMRLNSITAGYDTWKAWLEIQCFGTWNMPQERTCAAGCAFLRGQGRGRRVARVEGVDALVRSLGASFVDAKWPVPGQPRSSGYEGEGWVIVRADTTDAAVQALRAVVTQVHVVLGP
ncbi:MAG: ATP-grasp domain-containing protein [Alphaproteobacteria bacterium]|nr:ATP-grasp domain-containing protein [Alphaproteobacteria bacterium]MCB9692909.1 ATP-grasp domain-containing protein [Alphaproteobacteria bacterium]